MFITLILVYNLLRLGYYVLLEVLYIIDSEHHHRRHPLTRREFRTK